MNDVTYKAGNHKFHTRFKCIHKGKQTTKDWMKLSSSSQSLIPQKSLVWVKLTHLIISCTHICFSIIVIISKQSKHILMSLTLMSLKSVPYFHALAVIAHVPAAADATEYRDN